MDEETTPILFTLAIDRRTGQIHNVSNVDQNDLPMLYRALRIFEGQIFEDITSSVTLPPVGIEEKSSDAQVPPL